MTEGGLADLIDSIEALATTPRDVLDEMLYAQAEIVESAQKRKGLAYGVHRTGVTLDSIAIGKPYDFLAGRAITIAPRGKNKNGVYNVEVAFMNEYGRPPKIGNRGQKARPFIRDANKESEDDAHEAAAHIYDEYISSKNL